MDAARTHLIGVSLILAATAFFAIAGVFTKMATADAWVIAGWRGLIGSILISIYVFWRRKRQPAKQSLKLDRRGWFLVANTALASILFIIALKNTYVANMAAIYATTPFVAAGIAWLWLRERVSVLMLATSTVSVAGVVIIVFAGLGGTRLLGDSLAVLTTLLFAIYVVAIKAFKDTPVQWTAAVGAFGLFLLSILLADPFAISLRDFLICALFGFTFATAMMLMAEGARMIPVAETALIGTLDVPFAIAFAWLLIGETPPQQSIIGASIVVAAVSLQAAIDLYRNRTRLRRKPIP